MVKYVSIQTKVLHVSNIDKEIKSNIHICCRTSVLLVSTITTWQTNDLESNKILTDNRK
jgi:hypothetical protein